MKIKRSVLEQIIREELRLHIEGLLAEDSPGKVQLADAQDDKKDKDPEDKGPKKAQDPAGKANDKPEPKAKDAEAPELPVEKEPADKKIEKDAEGEDGVEDAEDVTGGKIADEVTGLTIQSLTMEPKSKLMPGAVEIVVTFTQKPDPLRILVNKSGTVKFFYKGVVRNSL